MGIPQLQVTSEFSRDREFMRSTGVFFVVSPNEMLNKELCGQLNETP